MLFPAWEEALCIPEKISPLGAMATWHPGFCQGLYKLQNSERNIDTENFRSIPKCLLSTLSF